MPRPRSKFGLPWLAALLLGLATLITSASLPPGTAHLEKSDCAQCHLASRSVTQQQANVLLASQESLCSKCHPASTQVSHPTGFRPKTVPPGAYQLDWKGDLTCSTCHDVHGNTPGLLRGTATGKQLCLACHQAEFFKQMRDGGASLNSGHLAKVVNDSGTVAALDAFSRKCMECHGANATPRLATTVDSKGVMRHVGQSVNHPIGMNYQKAIAFGGYRPKAQVERKLLLPDGRMSCVSCHGGYQKEHGKLAVAMTNSKLCFECHNL